MYTVRQLAAVSGVTVRTLHHYDAIGLLSPACLGANGYRYYGREELLRLQQILFYRELGVPLGAIPQLLTLEGTDQISALRQHKQRLEALRERYKILIDTIDHTIAQLQGNKTMADADLYKGFSTEKQAEYEAWLIERHGEPMRRGIEASRTFHAKLSRTELDERGRQLHELEESLADALRRGMDPEAEQVDALVGQHRSWVGRMWGRPCPPAAYAGLADLYLSHPDFVARYERIEKGFAEYLAGAMKAHARRWHTA